MPLGDAIWTPQFRQDPCLICRRHGDQDTKYCLQDGAYCDFKYAPPEREYKTPVGISFFGGELDGRDEWVLQSGIGLGESPVG